MKVLRECLPQDDLVFVDFIVAKFPCVVAERILGFVFTITEYVDDLGWRYKKVHMFSLPHGRQFCWHKNGQLGHIHNYHLGEQHGKQEGWFDKGERAYLVYYEHGKRHGTQKSWYTCGTLHMSYNYQHGERHGKFEDYNGHGKIVEARFYDNGMLVSKLLE